MEKGTNIRVNLKIFGLKMMGEKGTNIRVNCEKFGVKSIGKQGQMSE